MDTRDIDRLFYEPFANTQHVWEEQQYDFPWSFDEQQLIDFWTTKSSSAGWGHFNQTAHRFNHRDFFGWREAVMRDEYLKLRRLILASPRVQSPFYVFRGVRRSILPTFARTGDLVLFSRFSSASLMVNTAVDYSSSATYEDGFSGVRYSSGTVFVIHMPRHSSMLRVRMTVEDEMDEEEDEMEDQAQQEELKEKEEEEGHHPGKFTWTDQMDPDSEVILPDRLVLQIVAQHSSTGPFTPSVAVVRVIGIAMIGPLSGIRGSDMDWEELYVPLTRSILNAPVHVSTEDATPPQNPNTYFTSGW
jgi:hypothetical protein